MTLMMIREEDDDDAGLLQRVGANTGLSIFPTRQSTC